ncbi:MAG: SH3 domain-containing protein [Clostridia bacterium]|nr:SH3 domain-containing protein [Clostridia bacterium]
MKHMSIKKLAGMTAAAAMMLSAIPAMADTADSALVQGGALNLRETASLQAKVLGQFPTGTLVEITERGDEWHKVEVGGKTGYMMAKFLNTATTETTATVRTNTGIGLNLREEPSMEGKILTSVKNGGEVTVLQKGKSWSRVTVNGIEGFMSTQYLNFGSTATPSPDVSTGKVAIVNNPRDTQVLNLRQGPSLDAKVLDYYRNGVKVTILKAGDTWHKVQVEDGKIGYMMTKFLKETDDTAAVAPFQAKLINVNGGKIVNFRKGPSLNSGIINTLPVGSTVTVIEHGTDWCKVDVNGTVGYISTWFMTW